MWRSFFLAIGISTVILGAECLLIDKAVLAARDERAGILGRVDLTARNKEVVPPNWAPWSLMSTGAVTMLYSFTIPKRVGASK